MSTRTRRPFAVHAVLAAAILGAVAGIGLWQAPAAAARMLLLPVRQPVTRPAPGGCHEESFEGSGLRLAGWRCAAGSPRRGTLVYLHGVGDNRTSGTGVIDRLRPRGFDVIAYDSRAHGASEGTFCTYGHFESQDLRRVIDTVPEGPLVLLGASLGAAVALQHAAVDPRVSGVIAAETFADLRTIATERAPVFFTAGVIGRAFQTAERLGAFRVEEVSPERAAARIRVPVLLIHGEADVDTPPSHSRRVLAALNGPGRLILIPRAGHNASLNGTAWAEIDRWLDTLVPAAEREQRD